MKSTFIKVAFFIIALYSSAIAQNNKIMIDDLNKIAKQTADSLPVGWTTNADTANPEEFIIQSEFMDLQPDMTSNDPPSLRGSCEIFILVVNRVAPDSINAVRKKNKELQNNLPSQNSKDNLKNWYKDNSKTLKIIDSEPTHYDKNYSYRIKCRRLPKTDKDMAEYNKTMSFLNRQFTKY